MALNPPLWEAYRPIPRTRDRIERGDDSKQNVPDLVVYQEAMVQFRLYAESEPGPFDVEVSTPPELFGVGSCYLTLQRMVFVWTPPPSSRFRAFEVPLAALRRVQVYSACFSATVSRIESLVLPFAGSALRPFVSRLVVEAQTCTGLDDLWFFLRRTLAVAATLLEADHANNDASVEAGATRCTSAVDATEASDAPRAQHTRVVDTLDFRTSRLSLAESGAEKEGTPQGSIAYADNRTQPPRIYLPVSASHTETQSRR